MDTTRDLDEKRQILAAATFRFASPLQGLRENVHDQILVKLLYDLDSREGVNLADILQHYGGVTLGAYLPEEAALDSLKRLCDRGEVEIVGESAELFRLAPGKEAYFRSEEEQFDRELAQLICRLFGCNAVAARRYEKPFLTVISKVSAELGYESASQLLNGGGAFTGEPRQVDRIINDVTRNYPGFNTAQFRFGVYEFLQSQDPACHGLLWRLSETYFVLRLMGIDPSGRALSRELFQETVYFLDTNTILASILKSHDGHNVVTTVLNSVRMLRIPVYVTDATLDELDSVLKRQYDYLERIIDRGGSRWLGKLDSPFLREYDSERPTTPTAFFSRFDNIVEKLEAAWGTEVVYLSDEIPNVKISEFSSRLQEAYRNNGGERAKSERVAFHDASVMFHIIDQRRNTGLNIWLLTLDGSLPGCVPENTEWASVAIAPRSVVQWLAPVMTATGSWDSFPSVFAEMVQSRFLPQRQFFSTSDFVMLLDVHENVSQIPDDDVSRIMFKLKSLATELETTSAEGRERFTSIVSATLSDRTARMQQRISELERAESAHRLRLEELDSKRSSELENERQRRIESDNMRLRIEGYVRFWAVMVIGIGGAIALALLLGDTLGSSVVGLSNSESRFIFLVVSGVLLLLGRICVRSVVGENRLGAMPVVYRKFLGD